MVVLVDLFPAAGASPAELRVLQAAVSRSSFRGDSVCPADLRRCLVCVIFFRFRLLISPLITACGGGG